MRSMPYPMNRKPGPRRAFSCVRRSTRAAARTLPARRPSKSVTGGRTSVWPVETEVSDGLYLVVTDRVLHRLVHRDAYYGTDVHVRFPVRAVGANSEARASCLVGRVLTPKDRRADTAQASFENGRCVASQQYQQESGPDRALFFDRLKHIVNNNAGPAAASHGSDSAAGTRSLPGVCGTDVA
jgi:hypothetical protein